MSISEQMFTINAFLIAVHSSFLFVFVILWNGGNGKNLKISTLRFDDVDDEILLIGTVIYGCIFSPI